MNRTMLLGSVALVGLVATLAGCAAEGDEEQVAIVGGEETVSSLQQGLSASMESASGSAAPAPSSGSAASGGSAAPALATKPIKGSTTSANCVGLDNEKLVGLWSMIEGADAARPGSAAPKVGAAFGASVGSVGSLKAIAENGTYVAYRHGDAKWAAKSFTAQSFASNAARGDIWHCQGGADSSAYVTPGSNLSIPISQIPSAAYIPPAQNYYKSTKYVQGYPAQYWLGQYDPYWGTWSGTNWNWISHTYSETGTCDGAGCTGHVFNEPAAWVRNGYTTNGTAIKRYGRRLASGAIQMVVLRPAVVSAGGGRYRAAENGGGVEWNVAVPTYAADAIGN